MQENSGIMSPGKILFSFEGRINRAKFWLYSLLLFPIWLIGLIIDISVSGEPGVFYWLAIILCFWPSLALNVKRFHDRDKSGWFYLVAFVPIVSLWYLVEIGFLKGTDGDNRFGPDPLGQASANVVTAGIESKDDAHISFLDFCYLPISKEFAGIKDVNDPRKWSDFDDLKDIPEHANNGRTSQAMQKILKAESKYTDFHFVYGWKIILSIKSGDIDGAERTLYQGLRHSKRKSNICSAYATSLFNADYQLKTCILWWIISAQMQLEKQKWTTHDPFLYLSFVAKFIGDHKLSQRLLETSDKAAGMGLGLNNEAQNSILQGIRGLNTKDLNDIRTALDKLGTRL